MQNNMTGRDNSTIAALKRTTLFRALPVATLTRLAEKSTFLTLSRGTRLPGHRRRSPGVHAIVSGCLMLNLGTPSCSKVMDLVGTGGYLGLASAILGVPETVTAEAIVDSSLLLIPRATLLECGEDTPQFALRLATALSRQVLGFISDIEAVSLRSGHERVADYLLRLANGAEPRAETQTRAITLPAKKSIIASRLNLTPEYFSRVLHDLTTTGAITVNGRQITVPDPVHLRPLETNALDHVMT